MEKKKETGTDAQLEKLEKKQNRMQEQVRRLQKTISEQALQLRGFRAEATELKQKIIRRDDYIQKLLNRSLWDRIRNVMP